MREKPDPLHYMTQHEAVDEGESHMVEYAALGACIGLAMGAGFLMGVGVMLAVYAVTRGACGA